MNYEQLIRPNLLRLEPYRSARSEYSGRAEVWLDANENPFDNGLNRYPDPLARTLRRRVAELKGLEPEQVFLGNGSDEVLDLVIRLFCRPGVDEIVTGAPTYGMYRVLADIHDVACRAVPVAADGQPDVEALRTVFSGRTKVLFLCSPNNPSGQSIRPEVLEKLLASFPGLVVLDEAYIDFSEQASWTERLAEFPNLLVCQTLSKAWGRAGLRLGMAFASPELVNWLDRIKPPYNLNSLTQREAFLALQQPEQTNKNVHQILKERQRLQRILPQLPGVEKVFPSDANFLLVRCVQPEALHAFLLERGIVVRKRLDLPVYGDCLRITIGTSEENNRLLEGWRGFYGKRVESRE